MDKLCNDEISRYSRQLLMPEIGMNGQIAIKNSSVLICGAGGLGCPSAMYLCAAGIGKLGIVDYDVVERNNLHRQVIHSENSVGIPKVESAAMFLKSLNSSCEIVTHKAMLDRNNILTLVENYDIVLDCSDNAPTRYLINDACILRNKPLVSASALKTEGQITVYGFQNGPCYRCIFPKPPPAHTVTNCSDGGVIGCLVGILGSMQAMEAIKIIIQTKSTDRDSTSNGIDVMSQKLLMYHAFSNTFRVVKLRPRNPQCEACGNNPTITENLVDYQEFCGQTACDKANDISILDRNLDRIDCHSYMEIKKSGLPHILLDVRDAIQYDICRLENSINANLKELNHSTKKLDIELEKLKNEFMENNPPIYVICRRGNSSQEAVQLLRRKGYQNVKDIIGGITSWATNIDRDFPIY